MKETTKKTIGVFGDSYAAKGWSDRIWWQVLRQKYQYQVKAWGEAGSSIEFSAMLLDKHAADYDHCVWCVTSPGRHTVYQDQNNWVHALDGLVVGNTKLDPVHRDIISKTSQQYRKWIFDWNQANFAGRAMVHYVMHRHNNILVIPVFRAPIYSDFGQRGFNLYDVSEMEARHHFGENTDQSKLFQKYIDTRPGHLCDNNNEILAELIHNNLEHKILEADISIFQPPSNTLEESWSKK